MISCVVVFDGRITRVVNNGTHQWLLRSCVKLCQTALAVLKNSVRHYGTIAEMGRFILCAFHIFRDGTGLY